MIVRKLTHEDSRASNRLFMVAYEHRMPDAEADLWFEADRTWGAFDENGLLCSQAVCHDLQMRFDGHWLPLGGIGGVATLPSHRRQGYAGAVLETLLWAMHEEGRVFSYLYPFSFAYYRKYGYESAYLCSRVELPLRLFSSLPQPYTARMWEPDQPIDDFIKVYNTYVANRNLAVRRDSEALWKEHHLPDDPWKQRKYAYLLYDEAGSAVAYFIYEAEDVAEDEHKMCVTDWAVATPAMLSGLLALMGSFAITCSRMEMELPADLHLELLLPEVYEVNRRTFWMGMVRLINVEAALKAMRPPPGSGRLILQVEDHLPWNKDTFRVEFEDGQVRVQRSARPPDLRVTVQALARLLLGAVGGDEPSFSLLPGVEIQPACQADPARLFVRKPMVIADDF